MPPMTASDKSAGKCGQICGGRAAWAAPLKTDFGAVYKRLASQGYFSGF